MISIYHALILIRIDGRGDAAFLARTDGLAQVHRPVTARPNKFFLCEVLSPKVRETSRMV